MGAAIRGRVVTAGGIVIAGATVTLSNASTGALRRTVADDRGAFLLDNLEIGGPYRLEARAIGRASSAIDSLVLHLGDQVDRTLVLGDRQTLALDAVVVRDANVRDAGAGGASYSIPGAAARRLPLRDRNFTGLLWTAPEATPAVPGGSPSISGQHPRFNAIQVDGGSNGDFFGVNATPTAAAGGKALSLEAIEEIRVLVAPFDVRQGGFSGGLINAVTRSGTNTLHGSVFSSVNRPQLVGTDSAGAGIDAFSQLQYGASVGGPIVRDRLHYFVSADVQARQSPFAGPMTSSPGTGISDATALRAAQIFRDQYGFDAGGPGAPFIAQPNVNLFLKLSGQPSPNHWLELTQSWVDARGDVFNRASRTSVNADGWALSNSGYVQHGSSATTRLRWTSSAGAFTNEMIASVASIADNLASRLDVPLFLVGGDAAGTYLAGGSVKRAQGTETGQRIIELTGNLSWQHGAHLLTAGTQDQLLHFRDNLFLGSWGVWTFANVDSLAARAASRYEVGLPSPLNPAGPLADFPVAQLAAYVQDRWSVTPRVSITAGVRADVPFFGALRRNAPLAANDALGNIDTSVLPSGNTVMAPRVGFAMELGDSRATVVRGGAGAFTGRPVYAWLSSAFSNTGQDQTVLVCNVAQGVPAPTTDTAHPPSQCTSTTPAASVAPSVTVFDPGFRFQQAMKYHLAIDHQFAGGITVSLEAGHTRTANTLVVRDVNLAARGTSAEGRTMYGSVLTGTLSNPNRLDTANFGAVYRFSNVTADRSTSVSAVVQKHWGGEGLLQVGYTWSHTEDVMSLAGFNGLVMIQNNPIDGDLGHRNLRTSARDVPHSLVAAAVVPMSFGITTSLVLHARSGTPYAWSVDGDANGDNTAKNDLLYVPRDATDVSLTNLQAYPALESFIQSEPCLRSQRGHIMQRNSCRNPGVWGLDGSVAKAFQIGGGRRFEVTADLFNLPNLLNRHWGLVRQTTTAETAGRLLTVAGWDSQANRPRYSVATVSGQPILPGRNAIVPDSSRWRIQLGARFSY